jgi:hypothetical protein
MTMLRAAFRSFALAPKSLKDDTSRYGHVNRLNSSVIQIYTALLMKPEVVLDMTSCNWALC